MYDVRWQHHDAVSWPNRRIWGSNVAGPNTERMIVRSSLRLAIGMQNERELINLGIEKAFWIADTYYASEESPFAMYIHFLLRHPPTIV